MDYWYLIPTGPILNSGPAASCKTESVCGGKKAEITSFSMALENQTEEAKNTN